MSVYGRVEEVHQENSEPLEYQIEQESHHRESSRLPLVKILLWSTLATGITLGVPLLLDLMSAQEVQDFMQVGPFIRQGRFTATIMEVKVCFIIC